MIALYPMLVSNTVSRNIIPGIAKVLENYLMVYGMTSIMHKAMRQLPSDSRPNYSFKKRLVFKESEDYMVDFFAREVMFEQSKVYQNYGKGNKSSTSGKGKQTTKSLQTQKGQTQYQQATGGSASSTAAGGKAFLNVEPGAVQVNVDTKDKDKAKDARVDIGAFDMKSVSLEPTWMKTDIIGPKGDKTSGIIGVKVVPYPVKSDAKLAHLLMYDRQVSNLQSLAIRFGRKVENAFYRAWKVAWKVMTLGIGTGPAGGMGMTGDPKHDILARRTILKAKDASDIFVVVNQADLSDDFYASANGILNLFRMGWSSIIIVDDVNRRVSFCMRELKGMCSMMPFTMLYQTYQQAKVYEDLEDAKRSASSIFKVQRKKFSKIVGESIAQHKTEEFGMQNLQMFNDGFVSEMTLLDENIGSFMKSMTPAKMKSMLPKIMKGETKGLPVLPADKLLKMGMKINPEFKKSYILAKRVLDNSTPDVKGEAVDLAAIGIAARASLSVARDVGVDLTTSTKEGIKEFIVSYRKNKEKAKADRTNMPSEHYAAAIFGWVGIASLMAVVGTVYGYAIPRLVNLWKWAADADPSTAFSGLESGVRELVASIGNYFKDASVEAAVNMPVFGAYLMLCILALVAFRVLVGKK
jgi:hypothetical protein